MDNPTPTLPTQPSEYAPWVAEFGLRYAYGLCQCGCGKSVQLAEYTDARHGNLKGQPIRFIKNHHNRVQPAVAPWVEIYGLLQPYGKCQCGCGQDAPIAKSVRKDKGIRQGQPVRFIHAHGGRVQEHPSRPIEERFWELVDKGDGTGCWDWKGSFGEGGYALLATRKFGNRAARISYILHYGSIPRGLYVCHHCDNPRCVRPEHLFLGTPHDNVADMIEKGRHAHGERHWKSKLTESDIPAIRALRAAGLSQQKIADRYGVSQETIGRIIRRKNWTHVP